MFVDERASSSVVIVANHKTKWVRYVLVNDIDRAGFVTPLVFLTDQFHIAGDIGNLDNDSCLDILVLDSLSDALAVLLHTGGPGVFTFTPPA